MLRALQHGPQGSSQAGVAQQAEQAVAQRLAVQVGAQGQGEQRGGQRVDDRAGAAAGALGFLAHQPDQRAQGLLGRLVHMHQQALGECAEQAGAGVIAVAAAEHVEGFSGTVQLVQRDAAAVLHGGVAGLRRAVAAQQVWGAAWQQEQVAGMQVEATTIEEFAIAGAGHDDMEGRLAGHRLRVLQRPAAL